MPRIIIAPDKVYELTKERYTIGRDPDNDIVIHSRWVSRHHAYLERLEDGAYRIVDGSEEGAPSANGYYSNVPQTADESHEVQRFPKKLTPVGDGQYQSPDKPLANGLLPEVRQVRNQKPHRLINGASIIFGNGAELTYFD
jgi:hypothetical protein